MTSVRGQPPVCYVLPNAASGPRGNHSTHAMTSSQEFQALLKAQVKPSRTPLGPVEQATDLPLAPNIEAMLQQLHACRKMRFRGELDACDPVECPPQLSATAPMLPADIVIWIPVDIRTPKYLGGARRRRRRWSGRPADTPG